MIDPIVLADTRNGGKLAGEETTWSPVDQDISLMRKSRSSVMNTRFIISETARLSLPSPLPIPLNSKRVRETASIPGRPEDKFPLTGV